MHEKWILQTCQGSTIWDNDNLLCNHCEAVPGCEGSECVKQTNFSNTLTCSCVPYVLGCNQDCDDDDDGESSYPGGLPGGTIPGVGAGEGQEPEFPIGQPPPRPDEPKPRPTPTPKPKPRPTYPPVKGWPAEHDYKVEPVNLGVFIHTLCELSVGSFFSFCLLP